MAPTRVAMDDNLHANVELAAAGFRGMALFFFFFLGWHQLHDSLLAHYRADVSSVACRHHRNIGNPCWTPAGDRTDNLL